MENTDRLHVTGINKFGYGTIAKLVMRDKRLSIESKAIYAYICSFSGAGSTAFPTVATITRDFGISEKRFYKHRKQLIDYGYISVEQGIRTGSAWAPNRYFINTQINGVGRFDQPQTGNVENSVKSQINEVGRFGTAQNGTTQNEQTGNVENSVHSSVKNQVVEASRFDIPQNYRTTNKDISTYKQLQTSANTELKTSKIEKLANDSLLYANQINELMQMSINPHATRSEVESEYLAAVAKGYTPDAIKAAYERYARVYRARTNTPQYAKRLNKFLSDGDGLAFYVPAGQKPEEIKNKQRQQARENSKKQYDALVVALENKKRSAQRASDHETVDRIDKQLRRYTSSWLAGTLLDDLKQSEMESA